MNLEEAQVFVEMTSQPLTEFNRQARCVDGRYENIQNFPMIAKPGGDVGDVMAAFAALNLLQKSLPNEIVLDAVVTIAGGPQKFSFHTDDHAEPNQPGLGCSYIRHTVTDPEAFGLMKEQTDFLVAQLPNLLEQGAHQEVLHGKHAEQATIEVDSETHGIMPLIRVGDNVRSAFVYQKTLHTQQLDALGKILQEELAKQGEVIEDHEIRKALDDAFSKQLTEILKRLASNLPVYTAMIDAEGSISIALF